MVFWGQFRFAIRLHRQSTKDFLNARKYFELALSYQRHEYKNSIDSKARTELELLNASKTQS